MAGLGLVGEVNVKYVFQPLNQPGIFHGENNFHAVAQVAAHQVGAAQVDFLGSPISKIVNTAVFQEPSHDADHPDVVTHARNPGAQATNTAHEQIPLHA